MSARIGQEKWILITFVFIFSVPGAKSFLPRLLRVGKSKCFVKLVLFGIGGICKSRRLANEIVIIKVAPPAQSPGLPSSKTPSEFIQDVQQDTNLIRDGRHKGITVSGRNASSVIDHRVYARRENALSAAQELIVGGLAANDLDGLQTPVIRNGNDAQPENRLAQPCCFHRRKKPVGRIEAYELSGSPWIRQNAASPTALSVTGCPLTSIQSFVLCCRKSSQKGPTRVQPPNQTRRLSRGKPLCRLLHNAVRSDRCIGQASMAVK